MDSKLFFSGKSLNVVWFFAILFFLLMLCGCSSKDRRPLRGPSPGSAEEMLWEFDPSPPRAFALSERKAAAEARNISLKSQRLNSWREMEPVLRASLAYAGKQKADEYAYNIEGLQLTWRQVRQTLEDLLEILPRLDGNQNLLSREFIWYRIEPDTLLTGYYEPLVEASMVKSASYPYPIYKLPPEIKKNKSGPSRREIDFQGALKGRGLEIAWAKNLVDVFFLQIQGSGHLLLPDGSQRRILFAGTNGRKYVALGAVLVNRGFLTKEQANAPGIKAFLAENPRLAPELLSENPRYIFFKLGEDGPFGATGAKLSPLTCVAVAPEVIPMGAPLMLDAYLPAELGKTSHRLTGLTCTLDRGAMKGNHLDLFCGAGAQAESWAGRLRHPARVTILVSKKALAE